MDEGNIILNPILGCRLIWQCLNESEAMVNGLPLPLATLVLPICLHEGSREFIFKMRKASGSISKAVNKPASNKTSLESGKDLLLGLQERIYYMTPLTLDSLRLGISCNLIKAEVSQDGFPRYKSNIKILPKEISLVSDDLLKKETKACERLGSWFSNSDPADVFTNLKLRA